VNVSECRVKLWNREPVRAIVSITLDNEFVVKGIRIIHVQNRYIVCMPSRPGHDGKHRDVAHPINAATRERINQHILSAYQEEFDRFQKGLPPREYFDTDETFDDMREGTGVWAR
jgi:stage V sporulation protein G